MNNIKYIWPESKRACRYCKWLSNRSKKEFYFTFYPQNYVSLEVIFGSKIDGPSHCSKALSIFLWSSHNNRTKLEPITSTINCHPFRGAENWWPKSRNDSFNLPTFILKVKKINGIFSKDWKKPFIFVQIRQIISVLQPYI